MITPLSRFELTESFRTQKQCLSALSLISDIVFFTLKQQKAIAGKPNAYRVKVSQVRGLNPGATSAPVAVLYSAASMPESATHDPKFVRSIREMLVEHGCFRYLSGRSRDHKSPPCLYTCIDIERCLQVFQWLYAQFWALQKDAKAKGNKMLKMPRHFFSFIRNAFQALFGYSCSRSHFENDELTQTQETREFEGDQRRQKYVMQLQDEHRRILAEIENMKTLGMDVSGHLIDLGLIEGDLAMIRER